MSSVQALLCDLQDPRHGGSPSSSRSVLAELLALSDHHEPRDELLRTGIDILAALVDGDERTAAMVAALDMLLEFLVALASKVGEDAKMRIADSGPLLMLPLRSLRIFSKQKPSQQRNKCIRVTLAFLDIVCDTEPSREAAYQELVVEGVIAVLDVSGVPLKGPHCPGILSQDNVELLEQAMRLLIRTMEDNTAAIQMAVKLAVIPILTRVLSVFHERSASLTRTTTGALTILADEADHARMIVASNTVPFLCYCLRVRALASSDVDLAAFKLLSQIGEKVSINGQLINEDGIPVLFEMIERYIQSADVVKAACTMLDGIASFACRCKLDLSPFLSTDRSCRSDILIRAADTHGRVHPLLVVTTFRLFSNLVSNPVELSLMINSHSFEGLLAHYVHMAGATGHRSEVSGYLVSLLLSMRRATIETIVLSNPERSLPALFLCIRSHRENLRLSAQVFAILSKYWHAKSATSSAHDVTGFVAIAIDSLVKHQSICNRINAHEVVEHYNFIREVVTSTDGRDVILACGGNSLQEMLSQKFAFSIPSAIASRLEPAYSESKARHSMGRQEREILQDWADALAHNVLMLLDIETDTKRVNERTMLSTGSSFDSRSFGNSRATRRQLLLDGQSEYSRFVEYVLNAERNQPLYPQEDGSLPEQRVIEYQDGLTTKQAERNSEVQTKLRDTAKSITSCCNYLDAETKRGNDRSVNDARGSSRSCKDQRSDTSYDIDAADEPEETNDDGSDGDNDENAESNYEDLGHTDRRATKTTGESDLPDIYPRVVTMQTPELHAFNLASLQERAFCLEDNLGTRYPKHPTRTTSTQDNSSSPPPGQTLIDEPPQYLEPCRPASSAQMAAFVDQAKLRREQFLAKDPDLRARIVYENTLIYEDPSDRPVSASPSTQSTTNCPTCSPLYDVPEVSQAFLGAPALTFDSWFESGNLHRAIQIGEFEYDLVLRRDVNASISTNMQWFYFAVSNIDRPSLPSSGAVQYRFNIINLCKPDSLFNQGLQPVVYSLRDAHSMGIGWKRAGDDIYYFANPVPLSTTTGATHPRSNGGDMPSETSTTKQVVSYTLTFTLALENTDDTYLIAHSYPYTYTDHCRHMDVLLPHDSNRTRTKRHSRRNASSISSSVMRHRVLCKTISGRACDVLTITDYDTAGTSTSSEMKNRKAVVLTSRVHPGEAQASWIMRGLIDFLVSDTVIARVLRRLFVFTVVPMLNPDGVFYGNSRCSLSACDLNRQWLNPSPELHPTIYHTKELIRKEAASRGGIVLFCDIHGHSRKKNVFLYGCDTKRQPNPRARAFAKLFATQPLATPYVSYPDCSFKVSKDKESTARVVIANECRVAWCFTMEASFCGASFGELRGMHFSTKHMQQLGPALCETLLCACLNETTWKDRLSTVLSDHEIQKRLDGHATHPLLRELEMLISSIGDGNNRSKTIQRRESNGLSTPRRNTSRLSLASAHTGGNLKSITKKSTGAALSSKVRGRRSTCPVGDADTGNSAIKYASAESNNVRISSFSSKDGVGNDCQDECGDASKYATVGFARMPPRGSRKRDTDSALNYDLHANGGELSFDQITVLSASSEGAAPLVQLNTSVGGCNDKSCSINGDSMSYNADSSAPQTSDSPVCLSFPPHSVHASHSNGSSVFSIVAAEATRTSRLLSCNLSCGSNSLAPSPSEICFDPRESIGDITLLTLAAQDTVNTRTPKAPPHGVRFRGGGRQYAAVTPGKKIPRGISEIMRKTTLATSVVYDPTLISTSTISLRRRPTGGSSASFSPSLVEDIQSNIPPTPTRSLKLPASPRKR